MNSACSQREEQLVGLLYEEADEAQAADMRAHLAVCAGCRAELERLSATRDLLAAWPNAVNVPRMVYVNDPSGLWEKLRGWADGIAGLGAGVFLRPLVAAAAVVLVFLASAALLDLRVAPDGSLRIGLTGIQPASGQMRDASGGEPGETAAGITREEFQEGLTQAVTYMEDLFRSRGEEERRLLLATIDQRMSEQGLAMSQQLRGAMDAALLDMQRQNESDLGLVFSAIDELSVITGSELQRMNTILASFVQPGPGSDKE